MRDEESKIMVKNASDILLNPSLWRNQIVLNKQLDMTTPTPTPSVIQATVPTTPRKKKTNKSKSKRKTKNCGCK